MNQSPCVLETALGEHIAKYWDVHKIVEEIPTSMSVEDLISSDYKKEEVIQLKEVVFTLHKWHIYCSFECHEIHHETIEHQFTYQISTKSQES